MDKFILRNLTINDYLNYKSHINSNIDENKYINFINNILNENHKIIIVEYDNKIIGSGTLLIEYKMTYGGCKMGHIENILVNENMRGKKVGSMLLNYLTNIANQNKCYRIDLSCEPYLKKFYISNGFIKENCNLTMLISTNYEI